MAAMTKSQIWVASNSIMSGEESDTIVNKAVNNNWIDKIEYT